MKVIISINVLVSGAKPVFVRPHWRRHKGRKVRVRAYWRWLN